MRKIVLASLLVATSSVLVLACTGVVVTDASSVIVGGNEDWLRFDSYLWAEAATDTSYGVVYLGYEIRGDWGHPNYFWYEFHGINDQGLYFDSFGAPCVMPTSTLLNPNRGEHLMAEAMRTCATVEEAVALFEGSHLAFMQCQQFLFVDRHGSAAVVEGDDTVWMEEGTLVVTNFYLSNPFRGGSPCWRYDQATRMLSQDATSTPERVAEILEAVSHPATRYSIVVDLQGGCGDLYYAHDFTQSVKIDLFALAAVGCERTPVQDLVSGETAALSAFVRSD